MQHKKTRIITLGIALLLAASLLIGTAAAETAGTEQLQVQAPDAAYIGDTVTIPVILTGYPRGINQYSIEFRAQAPGITAADLTISLDKTMIQHTAASEPAILTDTILYRCLQTVKMAAFPDYGTEETPVGTIRLHLPESDSAYDAVISARIIETTSGAPLESLAAPKTGDIKIHVSPKPTPTPTPASPLTIISVIAALAAAGAAGISTHQKRKQP